MVEASKRKLKEQDFKKAKLKVGKKAPTRSNQTKIDVKSRALVMPGQISLDKYDDLATKVESSGKDQNQQHFLVNAKNASLKEILSKFTHHNTNVRKDAILGLVDFAQRHDTYFELHLGLVLRSLHRAMFDEVKVVRETCLESLPHLLSGVESCKFGVLESEITVYVHAILTHVQDVIRSDGMSYLSFWLDRIPNQLARKEDQFLPVFLRALSNKSGSSDSSSNSNGKKNNYYASINSDPTSKSGSLEWRIITLQTLEKFLGQSGGRGERENVKSSSDFPLKFSRQSFMSNLGLFSSLDSSNGQQRDESTFSDFVVSCLPLLIQCWVEASLSVLSVVDGGEKRSISGAKENVKIMESVMSCLEILLERLIRNRCVLPEAFQKQTISAVNKHIFSHFPLVFSGGLSDQGGSISGRLNSLCLCVMSKLAHLDNWQDENLNEKLEQGLEEMISGTTSSSNASFLNSLLDCVKLMMTGCPARAKQLVSVILTESIKSNPKSRKKRILFEFLISHMSGEDSMCAPSSIMDRFISEIPRFIWELYCLNISNSNSNEQKQPNDKLFKQMIHLLKIFFLVTNNGPDFYVDLSNRFLPLFCVSSRKLYGPFHQPNFERELLLDTLLNYMPMIGANLLTGIAYSLLRQNDPNLVGRVLSILKGRANNANQLFLVGDEVAQSNTLVNFMATLALSQFPSPLEDSNNKVQVKNKMAIFDIVLEALFNEPICEIEDFSGSLFDLARQQKNQSSCDFKDQLAASIFLIKLLKFNSVDASALNLISFLENASTSSLILNIINEELDKLDAERGGLLVRASGLKEFVKDRGIRVLDSFPTCKQYVLFK